MGRYAISCQFLTKRGTNKLGKGSKKHFHMSYLTILSILCFFMIFEKTFWSPELYHLAQQYIQRQYLEHDIAVGQLQKKKLVKFLCLSRIQQN